VRDLAIRLENQDNITGAVAIGFLSLAGDTGGVLDFDGDRQELEIESTKGEAAVERTFGRIGIQSKRLNLLGVITLSEETIASLQGGQNSILGNRIGDRIGVELNDLTPVLIAGATIAATITIIVIVFVFVVIIIITIIVIIITIVVIVITIAVITTTATTTTTTRAAIAIVVITIVVIVIFVVIVITIIVIVITIIISSSIIVVVISRGIVVVIIIIRGVIIIIIVIAAIRFLTLFLFKGSHFDVESRGSGNRLVVELFHGLGGGFFFLESDEAERTGSTTTDGGNASFLHGTITGEDGFQHLVSDVPTNIETLIFSVLFSFVLRGSISSSCGATALLVGVFGLAHLL
jgi:hypothetical protein